MNVFLPVKQLQTFLICFILSLYPKAGKKQHNQLFESGGICVTITDGNYMMQGTKDGVIPTL